MKAVFLLITLVIFGLTIPTQSVAEGISPGQLTGIKEVVYPDWFKDSFLDIAEDVNEASAANKHLILFFDLTGCPYCADFVADNFTNSPYTDDTQKHFDVIAFNIKGDREVALNEATTATEKNIAQQLDVQFTPTLIFLNSDNQVVAKIQGYRNPRDFRLILNYVKTKAYQRQSLSSYISDNKQLNQYTFRNHPQIQSAQHLKQLNNKPVAILFEDTGCTACDELHDGHLANPEVKQALSRFKVVRVDAFSDAPITGLKGQSTTGKTLAKQLEITYTPTWVLFNEGEQRLKIENQLHRYHFTSLLEYVGEAHYKRYADPFRYVDAKTQRLLAEGKDVSIAE